MYIYADIFLALNIILNGVILILTAWTAGMAIKSWRVIVAAAFGSVYALGELTSLQGVLYTPLAKFLVSLIIVGTAFPIRSLRSLTIAVACFYLVSLLFGGAVIGWLFFLQPPDHWRNGEMSWASVSWRHLAVGGAIAFSFAVLAFRRLAVNLIRRQLLYTLAISYNGRQVELVSRLDTGNDLHTLPERRPVILVSRQALEPLLSEEVNTYLQTTNPGNWLANLDECRDEAWLSRIQVIPYRGVDTSSIMLGFRPDDLKVMTKTGWTQTDVVVVGIQSEKIASDDSYKALLHPAVLQCVHAKEEAVICA